QVVLSRQYGSEGRFTFTSHTPGEHQICLHSNSTRMALFAGGKLVTEGLQGGGGSRGVNPPPFSSPLTLMLCFFFCFFSFGRQYREERFRMTSESTNQRVLWWSIAQTIILILTGIWQMRHLKSFF
ncbi:TMED4 protein, partial [Ibidorhyncha struthersii]|nr:TMED4 protein [Ibidorhyncha struthersii]